MIQVPVCNVCETVLYERKKTRAYRLTILRARSPVNRSYHTHSPQERTYTQHQDLFPSPPLHLSETRFHHSHPHLPTADHSPTQRTYNASTSTAQCDKACRSSFVLKSLSSRETLQIHGMYHSIEIVISNERKRKSKCHVKH
jgi:hypothetical protein